MWGALSDERMGLSFPRVTVSSSKSVVSTYNIYFTCYLTYVYMYVQNTTSIVETRLLGLTRDCHPASSLAR
jgi:hypothetical protein